MPVMRDTIISSRGGNGEARGPIKPQQATISTTTVSVKVMKMSGKQVTLSVFRQLEEASIFLAAGGLRGRPWGRVLYTFPGNRLHTIAHIVYCRGGKIYRCPIPDLSALSGTSWQSWVYDGKDLQAAEYTIKRIQQRLDAYDHILSILTNRLRHHGFDNDAYCTYYANGRREPWIGEPYGAIAMTGSDMVQAIYQELATHTQSTISHTPYAWARQVFDYGGSAEGLQNILSTMHILRTPYADKHRSLVTALERAEATFRNSVTKLLKLPQLFIAI